ncbi:MAG: methyltransferase domain-containing protein [Pseudomonadota bacterium]
MLCDLSKRYVQPGRILDIGCGTGISTSEIRKKFPKAEIIALDESFPMLAVAKEKEIGRSAIFRHDQVRNVTRLPGRFDMILAGMSFHWLCSADRLAIRDALHENGILAMSFPLSVPLKKRVDGNHLLIAVFRELKRTDPRWRPERGTRGLNWRELGKALPGLKLIHSSSYYMEEEFQQGLDFLSVLRVRGVFCGIFGDKAFLAEENAAGKVCDGRISYLWPIGFAIFCREANQSRPRQA